MTIEVLEQELRYPINVVGDCWLFTGGSKNGFHGSLYYHGEPWQAHRLAYTILCSAIPEGMNVLHHCDVGRCVNPTHLFLGTQQDNVTDMIDKGRSNFPQIGSKNGRARLTANDVKAIRRARTNGAFLTELARQYNVTTSTIHKIVNRQLWSHI